MELEKMPKIMNEIELKPLNILTAILLLDYYKDHSRKNASGDLIGSKNSFSYAFQGNWWNQIDETLKELFTDFHDKKDDKPVILFNGGKILLLSLYSRFYELTSSLPFLREMVVGPYPDDSSLVERGLLSGFAGDYNKQARDIVSDLLKEIHEDEIINVPLIDTERFFEVGEFCCNKSEMFGIITNAAYYTLAGFFAGNLGANIVDFFKSNKNASGSSVISKLNGDYGIGDDKFYTFGQMAMVFDTLVDFIERGIGVEFNDVLTKVFRAVGQEMRSIFDKRVKESVDNEEFIESLLLNPDFEHPYDRAYAYLLNITNLNSEMSIGSKTVDLRKVYSSAILFGNSYKAPFRAETYVEFPEANSRLLALQNSYRTIIDPCAYELLLRKYLADRATLLKTNENSRYITLWYSVHWMGALIERISNFWNTANKPLQIIHMEDMCERNELDRYVPKDINTIDYRDAFHKVQETISGLNMRFLEAFKEDLGTPGSFKTTSLMTDKYEIDSFTPSDIVPQMFMGGSSGKLRTIDGVDKLEKGEGVFDANDLNVSKLSKLNLLDNETDPENTHVLPRSVYDVVSSNSFNASVVEGEGGREAASRISKILRDLYMQEYLALVRG
jgi:hypothetical protein